MVKELLSQHLIGGVLTESSCYLDFCMYCFYRGMYYLENKNYNFSAYFFAVPVSLGLNLKDKSLLFNGFSYQMIKYLFFLKFLARDFDISECITSSFDKQQLLERTNGIQTGNKEVNIYLSYIQKSTISYEEFTKFCLHFDKDIKNAKLSGIKKLAEEELKFERIKKCLERYKKVKLTKLVSLLNFSFENVLAILKKNVMNGRINLKYDEVEDVIEVFDMDPRLKENVEETQRLYKELIECNKNLFSKLRDSKKAKIEFSKLSEVDKTIKNKEEEENEFEGEVMGYEGAYEGEFEED